MVIHKPAIRDGINYLILMLSLELIFANAVCAMQDWQRVDEDVKKDVVQLNVGLMLKLQNKYWVQVKDISSKKKYYVFTAGSRDYGYQVVGRGSAFAIANGEKNKAFFVTNKHVLDNADLIKEECEKFYAASIFYWQKEGHDLKTFSRLLANFDSTQNDNYRESANAIWDCYDKYLSEKADPGRLLYNRYKKFALITAQAKYFLHAPGSAKLPAREAKVYRVASRKEPDLAVLVTNLPAAEKGQTRHGLAVNYKIKEKDNIQLVGYPAQAQQANEYKPSFSNGKVTKLEAGSFNFDASLSKGFSGGPVINKEGKVIGIVTQRLLTNSGTISNTSGMAIKIEAVKRLAPFKLCER